MHHRALPVPVLIACVTLSAASGCQGDPVDDDTVPADDDSSPADDDTAWRPEQVCPGDPECASSGDGTLEVGAAVVPITPERWEAWTDANGNSSYAPTDGDSYLDCGTDRLCPEACAYGDGTSVTFGASPGYPGPDADGSECDQSFQAVWLAGFQNSRAMNGVHDELWARAIVLRQGDVTLGLVSVDLIGYFFNEVDEIRERARKGLGLDNVVIASTHVHEGPDTLGIWGRSQVSTGLNPDYMALLQDRILEALGDAQATMEPARTTYAHKVIEDDDANGNGINNFNFDLRDPGIHDKNVRAIRFSTRDGDATIATLVHWANHPETLSDDNVLVTADFVDPLRRAVEEGVDTPQGRVEGLGGIAVFFNGALGGMMSPLAAPASTLFGEAVEDDSYAKAASIGEFIGWYVLQALGDAGTEGDEAPALAFRRTTFKLRVDNVLYAIMFQAGVFDRPLYDYDVSRPVGEDNLAYVLTEVGLLQIGAASILTIPGELLPEWAVGGYDESLTGPLRPYFEIPEHAPDVTQAPDGPYLYDLMPGEHPMIFGLAQDELGYLIPPWQYVLDEDNPYLAEAPGDHYEETNSLGPDAAPGVVDQALALLDWQP